MLQEPLIHSHISDGLPDGHRLAWAQLSCDGPGCDILLHAANNECMVTWVESGEGNYCLPCFVHKLMRNSSSGSGHTGYSDLFVLERPTALGPRDHGLEFYREQAHQLRCLIVKYIAVILHEEGIDYLGHDDHSLLDKDERAALRVLSADAARLNQGRGGSKV